MGQMLLTGAGGGAANVLASAPWVAQWKFNNDGNDSVGANNLTNNNSATFTTGLLGGETGATQLVRASSQYWSIADNAALSTGDVDFTIALWVYLDTSNTQGLVTKDDSGANREYGIYVDGSNIPTFFVSNDGSAFVTRAAGAGIGTGAWACVIGWHDSVANTINVQVNDGTVFSTAHTTGVFNGTATFRVSGVNGAGNFLNGRIDNVCIAKSAAGAGGVLSAAQRTAFFNAGVGTETLT